MICHIPGETQEIHGDLSEHTWCPGRLSNEEDLETKCKLQILLPH
jgi:hypothetical protein